MEQYRKPNNSNTLSHSSTAQKPMHAYDHCMASLQDYPGYISYNKGLGEDIMRIYERQNKITDYMADEREAPQGSRRKILH